MPQLFHEMGLLVRGARFFPDKPLRPELIRPRLIVLPEEMEVEVNYGAKHAFTNGLRRGRFVVKNIKLRRRMIPVGGCGIIRYLVKEYAFNKEISVHNALHVVVMTHRLQLADPLTALAVAARYRRRHAYHEFVTLFTGHHGMPCHLVFRDNEGGLELEIDRVSIHHRYDKDARFLIVTRR